MIHSECFVVDGGWSSWSNYSSCSVTCGVGIQEKRRSCTEPAPAHGGASCVGESVVYRNCTQVHCPGRYMHALCPLLYFQYKTTIGNICK
jgi:hypothetical protein